MISNNGGPVSGASGGLTVFIGTSNAANASILNVDANIVGGAGGNTQFKVNSGAGFASITNLGANVLGAEGGVTRFEDFSTADHGEPVQRQHGQFERAIAGAISP